MGGAVTAAAAGGLLGFVWMGLFPRPDFRFEGTPALGGFLVGWFVGPAIGVAVASRPGGRGVMLKRGLLVLVAWPALAGVVIPVGSLLLEGVPLSVPVYLTVQLAVVAGAGALAGRLVAEPSNGGA